MGCSKSCSKREAYSNTILPQETRKASNRQNLTLHCEQLEKEEQKNTKVSRRKDINGKKIASLTSGAGKIGQPLVKE